MDLTSCVFCVQIMTSHYSVGLVTFQRSVQRRSWRPGETCYPSGKTLFPWSLCLFPSLDFAMHLHTCAVFTHRIHFHVFSGCSACERKSSRQEFLISSLLKWLPFPITAFVFNQKLVMNWIETAPTLISCELRHKHIHCTACLFFSLCIFFEEP